MCLSVCHVSFMSHVCLLVGWFLFDSFVVSFCFGLCVFPVSVAHSFILFDACFQRLISLSRLLFRSPPAYRYVRFRSSFLFMSCFGALLFSFSTDQSKIICVLSCQCTNDYRGMCFLAVAVCAKQFARFTPCHTSQFAVFIFLSGRLFVCWLVCCLCDSFSLFFSFSDSFRSLFPGALRCISHVCVFR